MECDHTFVYVDPRAPWEGEHCEDCGEYPEPTAEQLDADYERALDAMYPTVEPDPWLGGYRR